MNPPPKTCFVVGPIGKEGTDARIRADALLKQTTFLTALLVYAAAAPVAAQWQLTVNKDELTDERIAAFWISSSTPTRNAVGIPTNPKLILVCSGGHLTHLYVSVDIYVTDETKVQMRWDSGTPLDRVWQASKDNTALFAPEPNEILDSLLVHRRLVFRYFPYSENPQTATFILPPLTSRETSLKTHCWFSPAAELAGIAAEVASIELTPARDKIEIAEADRVLGRTLVKRVKNRKGQVLTSYVLEFRIDHPDDGRSLSFEGDTLPLEKGTNRVTVIVNGVAAVRVVTYVVK